MTAVTLSVVIATFNRARRLDECLRSLHVQAWQAGDEIVVIDNGSTDDTRAVIEQHHDLAARRPGGVADQLVPIHYVRETTPGKSAALQTGLSQARGEIVLLTDDDVRVGAGWVATMRDAMRDPSIVLAGGPVRPRWQSRPPRWLHVGNGPYNRLAAPIALLDYGPQPQDLGSRTLLGANMAIRRDALERLGGFALHLGKLRNTLLSGEDADLCGRVRANGWRGVYLPNAEVEHWVPATRMRLAYYLRWFYWSGITHAAIDEAAATPRTHRRVHPPAWVARHFGRAVASAAAAALRRQPAAVVDHMNDVAFAAGYAIRHGRWTGAATTAEPAGRGQPA